MGIQRGAWKELCYEKAETLGDPENAAGCWWDNSVC